MSRRKVHFRNPGSWYDLKRDGMFEKDRLKGVLKKQYKRETRNRIKREILSGD